MSFSTQNPFIPAFIIKSPSLKDPPEQGSPDQLTSAQSDSPKLLFQENLELRLEVSECKGKIRELENKLIDAQEAQEEQAAVFMRNLNVLRDEVAAKEDEVAHARCSHASAAVPRTNRVDKANSKALEKQVKELLHEIARFERLHAEHQCVDVLRTATQRIKDAEDLQRAAELETEGLRAMGDLKDNLTTQNQELHKQLADALECGGNFSALTAELAEKESQITELKAKLGRAHKHIAEIETKLRVTRTDLETAQARVVPPLSPAQLSKFAGEVPVTIQPASPSPLAFFRFVKQAIFRSLTISIDNHSSTAQALMAKMKKIEALHKEYLVKAARWEQTAIQAMDYTNAAQARCERVQARAELIQRENNMVKSRTNMFEEVAVKGRLDCGERRERMSGV